MEDPYRVGFTIALVIHSFDPIRSLDLRWSAEIGTCRILLTFRRIYYRTRYSLA